ncbi:hypothetical protein PHYC_00597 [Phycisphaerales bacterium]|nr:hypothetical protein PHYC_00597 [Phycisphaerales bacterium]
MLTRVRQFVNEKPWIGWLVAGLLLLGSVFYFLRTQRGTDPYSPDRMTEMVTIRFTDTNDEIEMSRGHMDRELRRRGDKIDPSQGIINPKTGQPTGFLFNKSEWEEMIARINREKEEIRATSGGKSIPPAPRKEPSPQPPPESTDKK